MLAPLSELAAPVRSDAGRIIANHVVIHEGVSIGDGSVIEDRARIGYDARLGARTRVVYGAYLCDRVSAGDDARIGGFVCDAARIGDRATVMGALASTSSTSIEMPGAAGSSLRWS